jgi:aspartate/methionine/tyrosine aminotransferase
MKDRAPITHDLGARRVVRALVASQIREVAEAGMGQPDILPFWFGEPDEVTPENIRDAAVASIAAGETFYSQNLGVPELREAIAGYVTRRHRPVASGNVAVTSSGVSALMLTVEALVNPGDRVVFVTPLWPNLTEIPKILGAEVVRVGLQFGEEGWTLDAERLLSTLVPGTRAVMINSPNNPTGWALEREAQEAILAHCRQHGIWIIADDVYERLYYAGGSAPSFLDLAGPDDRVVSTNSFSKAWLDGPAHARALPRRARFPLRATGRNRRHRRRLAARGDVRVLPSRRGQGQPRLLQAPCARGATGSRARQRVRT